MQALVEVQENAGLGYHLKLSGGLIIRAFGKKRRLKMGFVWEGKDQRYIMILGTRAANLCSD